jgi:hypothetical protein
MSRKYNPYIFYSEYYFISGAYHVINVVNEILTYSASCSDNMKEYLRNQVVSKQVALNESIRNEQHVRVNTDPDNDLDEDGFVVIKMRRPKNKNIHSIHVVSNMDNNHSDGGIALFPPVHNEKSSSLTQISLPFQSESESNIKEECDVLLQKVTEQVMRDIISDVITKLETTNKLRN